MLESFWVGDIPATPTTLEVDLPDTAAFFNTATAQMSKLGWGAVGSPWPATISYDGTVVTFAWEGDLGTLTGSTPGPTCVLNTSAGTVTVIWGATSPFTSAGIYDLEITLHGPNGAQLRLDPVPVVVEERTGWHSLASARAQWDGAPYEDAELFELLEVAKDQCEEFAPNAETRTWPPAGVVTANYRKAQLLQARNLWNSSLKDENDSIGGDGFSSRVFPMDWTVKNLLRPKRAVPVMY
jgi:hypothetical protein